MMFQEELRELEKTHEVEIANELVPICYKQEFKDLLDGFRTILKLGEYSNRGFRICSEIVAKNAHFLVGWEYRKKCMKALRKDRKEELKIIQKLIKANSKCFQIWDYRSWLIQDINDGAKEEIKFINEILVADPKNYHAWNYRMWIVKHFDLFSEDLAETITYINQDPFNNSVWNHRFFLLSHKDLTPSLRMEEINFGIKAMKESYENESIWNYIMGMVSSNIENKESQRKLLDSVISIVQKLPETRFSLQFLIFCQRLDAELSLDCVYICQKLAELDPIRSRYWETQASCFQK